MCVCVHNRYYIAQGHTWYDYAMFVYIYVPTLLLFSLYRAYHHNKEWLDTQEL